MIIFLFHNSNVFDKSLHVVYSLIFVSSELLVPMHEKAENYLLLTIRMVGPSTFMMFVSVKEIGQIKSIMTTRSVFNTSALLVAYASFMRVFHLYRLNWHSCDVCGYNFLSTFETPIKKGMRPEV